MALNPAGGDYYLNTKMSGGLPQPHEDHISCSMTYQSYMTTDEQEVAFEKKLSALFADGGELAYIKKLSDSEKVVACMKNINKHVSGSTSYDAVKHSAYYALCKGGGTCQAQSSLLYRMLREVGVANRILLGNDAGAHTYNIVLIDGKYYYCDPSANIVLKGSKNFKTSTLQDYFLTEKFEDNILSKISSTDYPLSASDASSNDDENKTTTKKNNSSQSNKDDTTPENQTTQNATTKETDDDNSSQSTMEETTQMDDTLIAYDILDDGDNTYYGYEENEKGLSIRAAGELEKFVSVEVDGEIVGPEHYTVEEGSTIVTFTKAFMDTLAEGEHKVKFNFTDGYADTNITVNKTEEPSGTLSTDDMSESDTQETTEQLGKTNEKDGGSKTWMWILMVIIIVAVGVVGAVICIKRCKIQNNDV